MVIIVYSFETKMSIASRIGAKDYSYYFVLEQYRKVLSKFATVIEIEDPYSEVDVIYQECQTRSEPCLFLSFTPPFKTAADLKCPTISVFAWEYLSLPTDAWGGDPHNDWRTVLGSHGCAITHSGYAVRAIKKAMGSNFPVWSVPAPVWDDYTKHYQKEKVSACSKGFDLNFNGIVIDFQGCKISSTSAEDATEDFEGCIERSVFSEDKMSGIHLEGIIYTTIFNPNDGRKNWTDLLWGFIWSFRDVDDVTLVMKLAYHDYETIRSMVIHEIQKLAPFKCRVVALHGYLNDDEYTELIRESTYIVNTAHGEGQCLPLMEYMSAGTPAIAPNHTAMEEYISTRNAFVVKSSLEWIPWPHDPRHVMRTFRYRINWESLYQAYLDSYHVAKDDPCRYEKMSRQAVKSLKKYCSEAGAAKKMEKVLCKRLLSKRDILSFKLKNRQQETSKTINELKSVFVREIINRRFMGTLKKSLKDIIKTVFRLALNFARQHPKLRLYLTQTVYKLGLEGIARSAYMRLRIGLGPAMGFDALDVEHLSPRARQIYSDLKQAIERSRQVNH